MYHIVVIDSYDVEISGLRITVADKIKGSLGAHNTDGISIMKSSMVRVFNTKITSGDDNLVIKEGSRDIYVKGLKLNRGKGISIGSLGEQGLVAEVTVLPIAVPHGENPYGTSPTAEEARAAGTMAATSSTSSRRVSFQAPVPGLLEALAPQLPQAPAQPPALKTAATDSLAEESWLREPAYVPLPSSLVIYQGMDFWKATPMPTDLWVHREPVMRTVRTSETTLCTLGDRVDSPLVLPQTPAPMAAATL